MTDSVPDSFWETYKTARVSLHFLRTVFSVKSALRGIVLIIIVANSITNKFRLVDETFIIFLHRLTVASIESAISCIVWQCIITNIIRYGIWFHHKAFRISFHGLKDTISTVESTLGRIVGWVTIAFAICNFRRIDEIRVTSWILQEYKFATFLAMRKIRPSYNHNNTK